MFSVAQCSWELKLDFCLPTEQVLWEGLAEDRAGGPVDLATYLFFPQESCDALVIAGRQVTDFLR